LSAAISWSAGKDSMLALLRAREAGIEGTTFLTMMDADGASKSHALPAALIAAQVDALGGRWMPVAVEDAPGAYGRAFAECLDMLRAAGHRQVVFGDIDLAAHRDWIEPQCQRAGLDAVFPLWGEPRAELAREVIGRGIRARIVCVDTARLDAVFCGVEFDAELLERLPAGVCPCGEEGEFHTFVWDGPGFARPLAVVSHGIERIAARPPLAPTELAFDRLALASNAGG
jgi:uncharacterized protein (TIGR00290 family)